MKRYWKVWIILFFVGCMAAAALASGGNVHPGKEFAFPRNLDSYADSHQESIVSILANRVVEEPFNLVATLIFLCAIIHTFLTSKFLSISHKWYVEHDRKKREEKVERDSIHIGAGIFHFLGEVEAIFGIWAIALGVAITFFYDWSTVIYYMGSKVNYTEPMFVVIIMALASSRPILKLAELCLLYTSPSPRD